MEISFQKLGCILLVGGLIWIGTMIVFHRQVAALLKATDVQTASIRHRAIDSVQCAERKLDITDRQCAKRLQYLHNKDDRHRCFAAHGVASNASRCEIFKYLVYVERTCPEPKDAEYVFMHLIPSVELDPLLHANDLVSAKCRENIEELLKKFSDCGKVCEWMKTRTQASADDWVANIRRVALAKKMELDEEENKKHVKRRKLKILLHMGLLTKEFGLNFGEGALAGGPLGELVQWSDLATALHLLGHDVVLSWSPERLRQVLKIEYSSPNACMKAVAVDVVFADLVGMEQIRSTLGTLFHYRCTLRILDVYGTEPEFNHPRFNDGKSVSSTWGGKGLNPQQFFTHFPHSPDNSFLGFVVPEVVESPMSLSDRALLYGKTSKSLSEPGVMTFLKILQHHFPDIHATMKVTNNRSGISPPEFVTNHGALPQKEFTRLLRSSRLYVGLGWPVEGPAGLEAIANGVTFLNPKFSPPRNAHGGKPTRRKINSQSPYAEEFIGAPHVHTVNINSEKDVVTAIKNIKSASRPAPKVNHEFTYFGFMERVNSYLENQEFCLSNLASDATTGKTWKRKKDVWPPESCLRTKKSGEGESCAVTCRKHNLTCERAFFHLLNKADRYKDVDHVCSSVIYNGSSENGKRPSVNDLCHAPSFDVVTRSCFLQSESLLYSCVCVPPASIIRLCPCRTYQKEQIALCDGCS